MIEEERPNSISDREVIQTDADVMPSFRSVPPGMDDGDGFSDGSQTGGGGGGGGGGTGGGNGDDDELPPYDPDNPYGSSGPAPTNFKIKYQDYYIDPQGNQIWDVVISWDEVPGAEDYDIRYAKEDEELNQAHG